MCRHTDNIMNVRPNQEDNDRTKLFHFLIYSLSTRGLSLVILHDSSKQNIIDVMKFIHGIVECKDYYNHQQTKDFFWSEITSIAYFDTGKNTWKSGTMFYEKITWVVNNIKFITKT